MLENTVYTTVYNYIMYRFKSIDTDFDVIFLIMCKVWLRKTIVTEKITIFLL